MSSDFMGNSWLDKRVYFFPKKESFNKKLSGAETFYCGMFAKGCFYFRGEIDIHRFIHAMDLTLNKFHYLFGQFYLEKNQVCLQYKIKNKKFHISLELDDSSCFLYDLNSEFCIPQKIDTRMKAGVTRELENFPMAAFIPEAF